MNFLDCLRKHTASGFRHSSWRDGVLVRWNARFGFEWMTPKAKGGMWCQVPWSLLGVGQLLCVENLTDSEGWSCA